MPVSLLVELSNLRLLDLRENPLSNKSDNFGEHVNAKKLLSALPQLCLLPDYFSNEVEKTEDDHRAARVLSRFLPLAPAVGASFKVAAAEISSSRGSTTFDFPLPLSLDLSGLELEQVPPTLLLRCEIPGGALGRSHEPDVSRVRCLCASVQYLIIYNLLPVSHPLFYSFSVVVAT
jgi:hypothetical protein